MVPATLLSTVDLGWMALLSPEIASRMQFGWTISVHIIFASLSIGLAPFIIYFTWKDVRTNEQRYARLRSFWVKVFAVGFVMGTVTGIPMSFQFGTNFPQFATIAAGWAGRLIPLQTLIQYKVVYIALYCHLYAVRIPARD